LRGGGGGVGQQEPCNHAGGKTLGHLAVAGLLNAGGFLVGGSLLSKGDPVRYVLARAFRIYPGLVAAVLFTMAIGAAFTTLPLSAFLSSPETGRYGWMTGTAIAGVLHKLPGVFLDNPLPEAVNGSLWTLPFELRMYGWLLGFWLISKLLRTRWLPVALGVIGTVALVGYWASSGVIQELTWNRKTNWLFAMFFLGVNLYSVRRFVPLRPAFAVVATLALVGTAALSHAGFRVIYSVALAYLMVYVVYGLPPIRALLTSDYSYGVYVYAFPVQQAVVALVPGVSAWTVTALTTPVVLLLAALSWHLIERPALRAVDPVAARLKSLVRRTV